MTSPRPSPADPATLAGVGAGGSGASFITHHPVPDAFRREDPADSPGAGATHPPTLAAAAPAPRFLSRPVRYPDAYCWYVLVCALDLMLTNTVIHHAGATEVNAIAARAIESAGFWGLIALKVCTMIVVLLSCEVIGEACVRKGHPRDAGKRLAEWAIAISAIPVVLTLLQLAFVAAASVILTH